MSETARVFVALCRCGPHLGDRVDLPALVALAEAHPHVVGTTVVDFLCTPAGRSALSEALAASGADRLVAVACSHRTHEETIHELARAAGLDEGMALLANIREQAAWITPDPQAATTKAADLLRATLARIQHARPLERRWIDVDPDLCVIGGGLTGIVAALAAAEAGRRVTLIDHADAIGGWMSRVDTLPPGEECAPCLLAPLLREIRETEAITVLARARVTAARGFLGRWEVTVRQAPRYVARSCIACGACAEACPVHAPDPALGTRAARAAIGVPYPGSIPSACLNPGLCLRFHGENCTRCAEACPVHALRYDEEATTHTVTAGAVLLATGASVEMEETAGRARLGRLDPTTGAELHSADSWAAMLDGNGGCAGRPRLADERPPARVWIQIAGEAPGRSEILLGAWLALRTAEALPETRVVLDTPALPESDAAERAFGERVAGACRVILRPRRIGDAPPEGGGPAGPRGAAENPLRDAALVRVGALRPVGAAELAGLFDFDLDEAGAPRSARSVLEPLATTVEGVYAAGGLRGAVTAAEAVLQGRAAVGAYLARLQPGARIEIEARPAMIDGARCVGCRLCARICPYHAVDVLAGRGLCRVVPEMCRGCGICVAACPTGAITAVGFDDDAMRAETREAAHA